MTQNHSKQFVHDGKKLWAVFVAAKSPDIKSFVIQDETLRLPTVDEVMSLSKKMGWWRKTIGGQFKDGSATMAVIRHEPAGGFAFLWDDIRNIPLGEGYIAEMSRAGMALQKVCPQVVLISKMTGQMPNDRSTGNESGE